MTSFAAVDDFQEVERGILAARSGYAPLGRVPGSRCTTVAAATFGAVAALCGVAVLSGRSPTAARSAPVTSDARARVSLVADDAGAPAGKRLILEGNLGHLFNTGLGAQGVGHGRSVAFQAPEDRQACQEHAALLFDEVLVSSGLSAELQGDEAQAFKDRFTVAMKEGCESMKEFDTKAWLKNAQTELEQQKPVMTQSYAEVLNSRDIGYEVQMQDWMVHKSVANFAESLGRRARPAGMKDVIDHKHGLHSKDVTELPKEFDAAAKWPKCAPVIDRITNQGECGSCFVFGAVASLEARLCIASDGAFSGEMDILSRGESCSCSVDYDCCQGGWEYNVMQWADKSAFGINSNSCVGYFGVGEGINHFQSRSEAPPCPDRCVEEYPRKMEEDHFVFSGVGKYQLLLDPMQGKQEKWALCKLAVFTEGPIPFGIYADYTFMGYANGIYNSCKGYPANHAVHFKGWGVDAETGTEYILGKNSWGTKWGLDGHFHAATCAITDCTIPGTMEKIDLALPIAPLSVKPDGTQAVSA